jgi:hypothetical protein
MAVELLRRLGRRRGGNGARVKAGERAEEVGGRGGGRVATRRARGARVGDVRPRGGRRLPRRHGVASARARGRRQARTRARARARARSRPGRLWRSGRKWGGGPIRLKKDFLFQIKFQILLFDSNSNFEDEKDIFTNCPQNKSCSKFNSLQLSFRALSKILDRF